MSEIKHQEHPAERRMREQFEEKYGDLSGVMRAINRWRNKVEDFRRPYNFDMEVPVTNADLNSAEEEMLGEIKNYAKSITELRAALSEREWRPIETAPKRGAYLVFMENESPNIQVAQNFGGMMIIGGKFDFDISSPTNWMPLPKPPIDQAMREGGE